MGFPLLQAGGAKLNWDLGLVAGIGKFRQVLPEMQDLVGIQERECRLRLGRGPGIPGILFG
jgi:hypothetical protein